MYGFLLPDEKQTGRRIVLSREVLCGLPVLQARIPMVGRFPGKYPERRISHGAELLRRSGVRRVLTPAGFPWQEALAKAGLDGIKKAELCRAAAAPLVLTVLELRGWTAKQAVVSLAGARLSTSLVYAAERLASKVSGIRIDVPNGGVALAEYLRQEYGLPMVPDRVRPALTAAFDESWQGRGAALRLWGEKPELLGAEVYVPGLELPESCDPQSLLAALWEGGLLSQSRLCARLWRNDP